MENSEQVLAHAVDLYLLPGIVAIIIAIVVVGAVILIAIKKM
jgi:hypothetical protein